MRPAGVGRVCDRSGKITANGSLDRQPGRCSNKWRTQENKPMRVIGAGFGRTGTMSMQAALEILGHRCYHMKEVTEHAGHLQAWHDFVAGRAPMDWQTLFKDFEATVDFPAC